VTFRIIIRPAASADLFSLYRYIAESSGRTRAGAYIDRIEAACSKLAHFPERGRPREDLGRGIRTFGFERRATIVFRVSQDEVEIIAIAYAGRDFEGELAGESRS
jgi:toxin ParE1/3/4